MKKFLTFLILLGIAGGGVYYYDPGLLGLDAPAKVSRKKGKKKKKADKKEKRQASLLVFFCCEKAVTPR